jgi:16S rRNA processing protein RimM
VDDDHLVVLGRVTDAYGVKGWVKVQPYGGAGDSALLAARNWTLRRLPDASRPGPKAPVIDRVVAIEQAKRHSLSVVAKPADSHDRSDAEALKGAEVWVRRGDFPPLVDDEFYWIDLVGCEVTDPQGASLGRVVAVDDHGAHPILQLDGGMLIPFVDEYLIEVDPATGRIVVDWRADWSA